MQLDFGEHGIKQATPQILRPHTARRKSCASNAPQKATRDPEPPPAGKRSARFSLCMRELEPCDTY